MNPSEFIRLVRRKMAAAAVGPSTLRGQGKGVLKAFQKFLASLSLERVSDLDKTRFRNWFDRQTEALLDGLPIKGRPWGAARKAINLFLRDTLYNKYLCREFSFGRVEPWLEVPLDSIVARELKMKAGRGILPQWPGLKHLEANVSDEFRALPPTMQPN